jgi:hypothetical protein
MTAPQIRFANTADTTGILACLLRFSEAAQFGFRRAQARDLDRLRGVIQIWIRDHYVKIFTQDHAVRGVMIAERAQDFWDPDRRLLQERVWWVDPEYRSTRGSARLWREWQQDVTEYLQDGRCDVAIMSTQSTHTHIDLAQRGWQEFERHWMRTT